MTKLAFIVIAIIVAGFLWVNSTPAIDESPPTNTQVVGAATQPTYFAEISKSGIVVRVIVADRAFIDSGAVGNPKNWVQTSMDGSIRKNPAGKGYKYDKVRDAFVAPRPTEDAIFDEAKAEWKSPVMVRSTTTPL